METYESGRESSLLQDMKAGTKTIECRLARSKFVHYRPGDQVSIREDVWQGDQLVEFRHHQLLVEIVKVEKYPDFKTMFEKVGFKNVIPRAATIEDALKETRRFYTEKDEKKYGVLAIYFKLV